MDFQSNLSHQIFNYFIVIIDSNIISDSIGEMMEEIPALLRSIKWDSPVQKSVVLDLYSKTSDVLEGVYNDPEYDEVIIHYPKGTEAFIDEKGEVFFSVPYLKYDIEDTDYFVETVNRDFGRNDQ